jgi:hypothetical protein
MNDCEAEAVLLLHGLEVDYQKLLTRSLAESNPTLLEAILHMKPFFALHLCDFIGEIYGGVDLNKTRLSLAMLDKLHDLGIKGIRTRRWTYQGLVRHLQGHVLQYLGEENIEEVKNLILKWDLYILPENLMGRVSFELFGEVESVPETKIATFQGAPLIPPEPIIKIFEDVRIRELPIKGRSGFPFWDFCSLLEQKFGWSRV